MKIRKSILKTPLFAILTRDEREMLVSHGKVVSYADGELILQQGKKSDGLYLIIEGEVIVTVKILGEGRTTITTLKSGHFFGEVTLIDKGLCATSVYAKQSVRCFVITNELFDSLPTFYPQVRHKIIKMIVEEVWNRLKDVHYKITKFMLKTPFFGEITYTTEKPLPVTYNEVGIDINQLHQIDLFNIFTKKEYDELIKRGMLINAVKYTALIQAGSKKKIFYIILRGAVQSSIIKQNKIVKLSVLGPMNLFASISIIDPSLSSIIDFTTCEQSILLSLSSSNIDKIKSINPSLWYKIFYLMCKLLVEIERSADKLDVRLNSEFYNR